MTRLDSVRVPKVVGEVRRSIKKALERSSIRDTRLVVGVSGGQDSLALLDALHSCRDEFSFELVCAHFDHGLRGEESDADAEFVERFCQSLGVECVLGRAEPHDCLATEEAARDARYGFLASVAGRIGTDTVVLGHTATDQAETVLLNVVRGAGLPGLAAMRTVSLRTVGDNELRLVRPLLSVSRHQTAAYCQAASLQPRLDASNLSVEFTRNRVRASVMPLLRTFNPLVERALVRLADNAAQAMELIDAEADDAWRDTVTDTGDSVELSAAAGSLPPPVLAALVRRAIATLRGDLRDVRQSHVDDVIGLLSGRAGRLVDLPGSLQACAQAGGTVIRRSGDAPTAAPTAALEGEHLVGVPGVVRLPGWTISAELVETSADNGTNDAEGSTVVLDPALADGPMWVRGWLPGDRISPMGMSGTKKIQDLFVDEKVPRQERGAIPLLVSERGVAWVAGHRVAEWAKWPEGPGPRFGLRMRAERRD
jgi:tRNA(Ile)-lysidine synthase